MQLFSVFAKIAYNGWGNPTPDNEKIGVFAVNFLKKANNSHEGRKNKSHIPFRLNFLFFIVFVLFAALIFQLAYLQIVFGPRFESEAQSGDTRTETKNVQRGMIYDSTGRILVGNNTARAVTYTKPLVVSSSEMFRIANNLIRYVDIEAVSLSDSNKEDYYLADPKHEKFVKSRIENANKITDAAVLYHKEQAYVKKHRLGMRLSEEQKRAATVFSKMNGAYALSTVYIKTKDVSDTEMAVIGENASKLPGIKIGTSWTRSYPNGESVKSVIGTVTSEKQGLPSDSINTLLAEGYSRNDSVGSSYIESQYENVLKGTKETISVETRNDKIVKEFTQYGGKPGDNIELTINSGFQNKVQKIMNDCVKSISGGNPYSPGAYAVVMNPNTGGIYALAGVSRDVNTGKITDNALGAINQTYVMGSVVKGAMVLGALKSGVITPSSNTLLDEPIKLKGTATKASWFNKTGGANMSLSASDALEVSSNAYMMKLAMMEGGFNYVPGSALSLSNSIFDKLRSNFKQFGLGIKTGIDIPGEAKGFEGPANQEHIGNALDLSFGNYDSYTTLQLAQYISTVANGGYRLQPHLLKSIRSTNRDGSLGDVKYEFGPNVLNVVDASDAQWNVVKEGLWKVVHGTSSLRTGSRLTDIKPAVCAKSGTAQTFYKTAETETLSLVTYAPQKNPQVAIAVAFPNISDSTCSINATAVKEIYDAYWKTVQTSDGLK